MLATAGSCGLGFEEFRFADSAKADAAAEADAGNPTAMVLGPASYTKVWSLDGGTFGGFSAELDTAEGQLLVAAGYVSSGGTLGLRLIRSRLDDAATTETGLTEARDDPSVVVDSDNRKLLIATLDPNSGKVHVFRCNLDATACSYIDISAGASRRAAFPRAVIDRANQKLVVVARDFLEGYGMSLYRCNLDGTACAHTEISAGRPPDTSLYPISQVLVDSANGKLLVVTRADSGLALIRCGLDGTGCEYHDVWAGKRAAEHASAAIDATNGKLLIVGSGLDSAYKPALVRCDLDATNCVRQDISVGSGEGSGASPSLVVDAVGDRFIAVAVDVQSKYTRKLNAFQCRLDGGSCALVHVSAEQSQVDSPSALIDPTRARLVIVARVQGTGLGVFSVPLR